MLPVHILGGPETGRRDDYIKQLLQYCQKAWGEVDAFKLYAQDTSVNQLLATLREGCLFANGKFVQLHGADQLKAKADLQALAAYCRQPSENSMLVLVADGYGMDKSVEDCLPKEAKKIFWELSVGEMERWVQDFFSSKAIRIEPAARDLLLELVESNTAALRRECNHLALFYPADSRITEADIEAYIAHNRSEDAFSLFDRLATEGFEQVLETWNAIMASREGNGVSLLAGLLWSFRRLANLHAAMSAGRPYEQAARSLRITSRKLLSIYDQARRRWPAPLCGQLIAFGIETDIQLRAMGTSHERCMVELFLYACSVAERRLDLY